MSWRPDPGALATDALSQPWTKFRGYAFPPDCSYWTLPGEGTKGEGPRDDTDSTSMAHTTLVPGPAGNAVPETDPAAKVPQDVVGLPAQDTPSD